MPTRTGTTTRTTLVETIGLVGGLLTLLAAPLLCIGLLRRRRELSELRAHLQAALVLESRLRAIADRWRRG